MMVVANAGSVDTCKPYDVAPLEAFQFNEAMTATPVAPDAGVASAGADGAETMVVKLHEADQGLVPPADVEFIRQ